MTVAAKLSDPLLPYLGTFSKVAELNSFTAAAKELGLTQAAVSQRIHSLEHALDVSLFDRHGGRAALNEAGRQLHPFAQRIMALHRDAISEVTGRSATIAGELILAASSIPGEHLLPAMLSEFRRSYPEIRVRVAVTDSSAVIRDIEAGEAHLGLVGGKIDNPHLQFEGFATDEMVVIVPPNHAWNRWQRISLKRLAKEPLILREPGSGSRWCLEQALAQHDSSISQLQVTLELGSNEAIKEAVLQGLGTSVISIYAVEKELRSKQLHAVRITDVALKREFFVVRDTRRPLPAPASVFLEFLQSRRRCECQVEDRPSPA